ncbi:MAG TPA: xanthine dehydrogenase family protein molybdopterin-binding subunit, partial [Burkholderiales bacterium]|nr:xanthine dehydrogenase family protein molybdopterin-binding subunit [Burkholderiales bacterium]
MNAPLIGARVQRKEDYRFLTGSGQFTDDVALPNQTYAVFVRSPHAHAKIRNISSETARTSSGVLAVYTGEDLAAAKVGGLPCGWLITDVNGKPMKEPPYPPLAQGKVRHVGERVAVVVAQTPEQARDAAEKIQVDYEELPAVADVGKARNGPAIHELAPDNTCYVWALGDKAAVEAAFAKAAHVTKLDFWNNRLVPNAIEPRSANAVYSRADDGYTLYVASQNPHVERLLMTAFVLGLPESKVRVVAPDVGGGFGSKIYLYGEDVVVTWAAKQLNRPVKWTAERSESYVSDAHGRDHLTTAELALDKDGKFLAMRVRTTANLGAYLSTFASCIPTILYATLLAGQYTTPLIYCEVTAVFTNTAPVDAYRGAGRPEATYVVERLLMTAFVLGLPESKVRVVSPDVGGGFGSKIYLYGEDVVVTWAAKQLNRPVKWTAERSESYVSDAHGRDHLTSAELALDKDGKFLAMRVRTTANLGAYLSTFASCIPTILYATLLAGQYTTPHIYCEVTAVFTNTTPVDAYRGAGRPEATYVVERLVETAAREMKMSPVEIRKQNFIREFPYQTPVALCYDTGNYQATLDAALKLADVQNFSKRKEESAKHGKLRGIGYACYIEACGIAPSNVAGSLGARAGLFEAGEIRVHPTGTVTVFTGSHSHGQGHETSFAQVVADRLGLPIEAVEVVHGDTSKILFGMGTYGSRSIAVGGTAIVKALDKIVAKGKKIAAHLLEASEADIEYDKGEFKVAGTDKK